MANPSDMGDYRTQPTLETFSFLPPFTADEIFDQVSYIIANGWTPAIEHESPAKATRHYWNMWKLPFFGLQDAEVVLDEVESCRRAYPDHLIRVIGYDNYTQSQGHSLVVYRPRGV